MRLSIIIPVYNEVASIRELLTRVSRVSFSIPYEVVIVDDGSRDGTREILTTDYRGVYTVVFHERNQGKGAAIRTGLAHAKGDIFVVQDADLEYNPQEIATLLTALIKNRWEVVYGSRALGKKRKAYSSYLFHLGGLFVTWWTNLLYGTALTDEATCYKMWTKRALDAITLSCRGFEFCPELTGKLLRAGFTIHEVPVSYVPRTRDQGKKIKMKDGVIALWTLFKIRVWPMKH